jgi:hypothetical protein
MRELSVGSFIDLYVADSTVDICCGHNGIQPNNIQADVKREGRGVCK